NRFALAYPQSVAAVAINSAGDYTLPIASMDGQAQLNFPYGIANFNAVFGHDFNLTDFQRVPFWIGVGSSDRDPAAVPRQWDPELGTNRVERAQRFAGWLNGAGVDASVHLFDGIDHMEAESMRDAAFDFLASKG